jgi:hypothetical protein
MIQSRTIILLVETPIYNIIYIFWHDQRFRQVSELQTSRREMLIDLRQKIAHKITKSINLKQLYVYVTCVNVDAVV